MPNKADILRENTHKDEGVEVERRIFYTLSDAKADGLQAHRNSKALGVLIKVLREKNILSDDDIDNILFEVVT